MVLFKRERFAIFAWEIISKSCRLDGCDQLNCDPGAAYYVAFKIFPTVELAFKFRTVMKIQTKSEIGRIAGSKHLRYSDATIFHSYSKLSIFKRSRCKEVIDARVNLKIIEGGCGTII